MTLVTTGKSRRWQEAARRHRCEICLEIFDCHLCAIALWHPLHCDRKTFGVAYVCEFCCIDPFNRYQQRQECWVDLLEGTHSKEKP